MAVIDEISKAFNQHATEYEAAAKVQHEIGMRLLERLQYLSIQPQRILDLGCGPGRFSYELRQKYPKAQIVGLDLVPLMLLQAQKKQKWRRRWSLVAADMCRMPFISGTFDLIFANQVIHWGALPGVFRELNRVMNVNGCLMFTTLGPDTFNELKQAWQGVHEYAHTNEFTDMHDVGDHLMSEHFLEPVIDMEYLTVHYDSLPKLIQSLKAQGVKNVNPKRNKGLTGKTAWQRFATHYSTMQTETNKFPVTYEVVYGHAWKGEQRKTEFGVEAMIPVAQIVRRKSESNKVHTGF